ncbi:hypothetical protein PTTG_28322 [Puccinia triticina 1-1 BBBD Race 1]|uniref:Uncharacterized protein n=1 Tax=Puccinia triticina (isolate 1-1 / race 1 (BBBD)) TaxID=630390 RepID=A0A180GCU1_PUCT1|nr:hypothetical protein PTTG_28322 [Puccinia triticina 1-1 BBBD Race 1]
MKSDGHGNLKVLLAIDEASNLINQIAQELRTIFFHVFHRDPSTRFHRVGVELFAPIYIISTLDVFVPQEPPSSWDELLSPERLLSYGCPFCELFFKVSMKKPHSMRSKALIAKAKLLLKTRSGSPRVLANVQCFVTLGSEIQTRVSLHSPINSELVASHTAHGMFINSTRGICCCTLR